MTAAPLQTAQIPTQRGKGEIQTSYFAGFIAGLAAFFAPFAVFLAIRSSSDD